MDFLYLTFLCLPETSVSGCGDKPWPAASSSAVCIIPCSNVRSLAGNLSDLTVASTQYDILLCSMTLVSDMSHVYELLVPGFGRGTMPLYHADA